MTYDNKTWDLVKSNTANNTTSYTYVWEERSVTRRVVITTINDIVDTVKETSRP